MKPIDQTRLKAVAILLFIILTVLLLYTALHEGGHALAGLAFGGKITDFNVNFFNLGAHAGIDGNFTVPQSAVINVAGASLPLLVWFLVMLLLPKKGGFTLQWTKIVFTMGYLNTLLAWIIIPFLYLSNSAPPSDDVTKFITNSGFPPLAVALGALALYAAGWVLFALRIGDLRGTFNLLGAAGAPLPAWKRILVAVIVLAAAVGAFALVFNLLGIHDPAAPSKGYTLAATIPLSERDYQSEAIAAFTLVEPADAAIFLRVERLNTPFIDVTLHPSEGDPILLLHGEDFSSDVSASQAQYHLPAGECQIVLTSQKSPGVLKVYFHLP